MIIFAYSLQSKSKSVNCSLCSKNYARLKRDCHDIQYIYIEQIGAAGPSEGQITAIFYVFAAPATVWHGRLATTLADQDTNCRWCDCTKSILFIY